MNRVAVAFVLPMMAVLPGCRALALILPESYKSVPAEYPYLADKKVCILVRAADETLFEYPNVQWEVADHVRVALEGNVRGISVVEPRKVVDFQRGDPGWERMDPAQVGQRFGADRVIEIDLTQYTTREPESPHLYRGHIAAAVRVYNTEYPDSQPAYRCEVQTVFPPEGAGQYGANDRAIRRATLEAFARDLAGKFYDRTVAVK